MLFYPQSLHRINIVDYVLGGCMKRNENTYNTRKVYGYVGDISYFMGIILTYFNTYGNDVFLFICKVRAKNVSY